MYVPCPFFVLNIYWYGGTGTYVPVLTDSLADLYPGSGCFLTLGSGSGIRDEKYMDPGSEIRDNHPGSYFRELSNSF
jgi:hypothetical protein